MDAVVMEKMQEILRRKLKERFPVRKDALTAVGCHHSQLTDFLNRKKGLGASYLLSACRAVNITLEQLEREAHREMQQEMTEVETNKKAYDSSIQDEPMRIRDSAVEGSRVEHIAIRGRILEEGVVELFEAEDKETIEIALNTIRSNSSARYWGLRVARDLAPWYLAGDILVCEENGDWRRLKATGQILVPSDDGTTWVLRRYGRERNGTWIASLNVNATLERIDTRRTSLIAVVRYMYRSA